MTQPQYTGINLQDVNVIFADQQQLQYPIEIKDGKLDTVSIRGGQVPALKLTGSTIDQILLTDATIAGDLDLIRTKIGQMDLQNAKVKDIYMSGAQLHGNQYDFNGLHVDGVFYFRDVNRVGKNPFQTPPLTIAGITVAKTMEYSPRSENSTHHTYLPTPFALENTVIGEDLYLGNVRTSEGITLNEVKVGRELFIQRMCTGYFGLTNSEIQTDLNINEIVGMEAASKKYLLIDLKGTTIHGDMNIKLIQNCYGTGGTVLDLSDFVLEGEFNISPFPSKKYTPKEKEVGERTHFKLQGYRTNTNTRIPASLEKYLSQFPKLE